MEDRLARTRLLLGEKGIEKLQKATVMVVGCGAVGSFAIEALARAGVGRLILVDFDVVKESNINRQLFALQSTLGQEKTAVARGRIHDISPDIQVEVIPALINGENVAALISYKPNFVIDAIDTLNPKTLLIESLVRAGIPFISSMGAALKVDPSKIAVVPMKKTINDPLAFFVRKRLRKRGVPMDFKVVYSSEDVSSKAHIELPCEPENDTGRVRHNLGSLPTVTGIFGLMCANECIKFLTDGFGK